MQKRFSYIILFLIVFLSETAYAQKRFRAGLAFGPTVTEIAGIGTRMYHKPGILTGIVLNTELGKKSALQFEIDYVNKGSLQPADSTSHGLFYLNINYIEIPILFKRHLKFNNNGKLTDRFDLEAGISYSRKIGKVKERGEDNYPVTLSESTFNNDLLDIIVGVGFNFNSNFSFSLRYNNSVIPAVQRSALNLQFIQYTYNQGNNMSFQFVFNYVFGKGGDKVYTPEEPAAPQQ